MFEFERRVNYLKNIIADNKDRLQDDDFIDYTNEIFTQWYNSMNTDGRRSLADTDDKYELFITNGIYKLVFTIRNSIKLSMFSADFYEYLLKNYPSYVAWFANHIDYNTVYNKEVNEYVDKYRDSFINFTHNVNTLQPILSNPILTISAIVIVNEQLNKYWYRTSRIETYLRLILLYFLVVSKYGKDIFSNRVVNQFKNKQQLSYNVYAIYKFLCNKFNCNPGWKVKFVPEQITMISKHKLYDILLKTDMFTEEYFEYSKHLNNYVKDVLRYNPDKLLSDNVDAFFKTNNAFYKPINISIPNGVNTRDITHNVNIIRFYREAYEK